MPKMMETKNVKKQEGFILLISYLLLAMLSVFSLAIFNMGTSFIKSADRNQKKVVAFNMAEAGFDKAYYDVKNDVITSFPSAGSYTSMNSGTVRGGYQTTVTDMGNSIRKIVVTGYSPAQSSSAEAVESRSITGYMQESVSNAFDFGVFAKDSLTMSGNNAQVDSYNSTNGAYGGNNVASNGDIATDATGSAVISIGNSDIYGDASIGPGGVAATGITVGSNGSISGSRGVASASQSPAAVSTSTASSGALSISGRTTVTLAAGTYHYTRLSIAGNGRLTATGAVTIYVSGTIAIAGNGITTSSSKPPNMLIYATGSSSVSLAGNGNLYAGIYAPNSAVSVTGNGALFGAVVSKTYRQTGNGNVHFDEALKEVSGGSSTTSVLSWQETGLVNHG